MPIRRFSPKGLGQYTLIGRGTQPVANGVLGRFDPGTLANGIYDVVLRVVDASGRETVDAMTYEVTENLKVGQFSVSFLDVSVEAAGIPVQVTRTYDTRRKGESLDFGHGWTVDYQNVRVQKNVTTGLAWNVVTQAFEICLRPSSKRKVSVTLPDGRVERFEARNHQECAFGQVPPVEIDFVPVGKTTATLEAVGIPGLLAQGGNLVDSGTLLPWNPRKFRLTTLERFVYELDEGFGITKVTEPNGNFLTYGSAGVVHSDGQSVAFARDSQGRITAVTDPSGRRLSYAYDGAGNLATVTDRASQQSVHKYDRLHTLTTYTDPRGTQLVRNEYDADGRLVAQYDATGAKIDLALRDLAAKKEVVKDRRGNITTYEYDDIGNVSTVTDALLGITRYTYDARGNEATVADPLGHVTTKTFDAIDNPLTEKDPLGNTTTYAWKPRSRDISSITDARNNVTAIDYTVTGNLGTITDPLNNVTTLGYDGAGNLASLKDGAGNRTSYVYDAKGRRTQETDPTGAVTTYAYDANGNATTVTKTRTVAGVAQALTTTRSFDVDGNVTSETDPTGAIQRTTYNALKKVATQADALGRVTSYDYEVRGYETRVTHPDGLTEQKSYDGNGNVATVKDRAGRVTTNTYDALDRLVRVTYADGTFVENGYDAAGRLTSVKDERGNATTHEYDAAGRRTKTVDAEGGIWLFEYDPNGNLTKATDPRLGVTTHEYDRANRRVKTTHPVTPPDTAALFETWEYDGAGRRTAWVDTAGHRTAYGYDGAGRLTTVTQPSPDGVAPAPVTAYAYDELGNKVSQTDALGRVTRWEYDALGRTTKRTLPGGQSETFAYDTVGNVASHTTFNGETIAYTYDALNRLATKTLPATGVGTLAHTVSYTYTPTGQVATVEDERGVTRHAYDARDRLVQVAHPEGWTVDYGYDAAGNRTSLSTKFGTEAARTTTNVYDRANRLTRTTSAEGEVTTFAYDAAGNRTASSLPNGTAVAWTYDARNRMTRVEHRKVSTNANIALATYLWNAQGLRSREDSTVGTDVRSCRFDHTYDRLGRLTRTLIGNGPGGNPCPAPGDWTYAYDAVGNRIAEGTPTFPGGSSSFTYDANDRLVAVTGKKQATYAYDAAGNLVKRTLPPTVNVFIDQVSEFRWDAEGRLVTFIPPNEEGEPIDYLYDAQGQLVRETRRATTGTLPPPANMTQYLADRNLPFAQIVEERDGTGALKTAYQFADGQLVKQVRAGVSSFYHQDHLSVGQLTDAAGNIVNRYLYSPFGEVIHQAGTGALGAPGVENRHLFAGERFNADSGLYYLRARHYDPRTGRFASIDPHPGSQGRPNTLNDYAYASGNPVDMIDPSGRFGLAGVIGAMNIAVIAHGAYTFLQDPTADNALDVASSHPTVFGALFVLQGVALASQIANDILAARGSRNFGRLLGEEGHHTIPEYMCGHKTQQGLVPLPKSEHVLLHVELDAYAQGLEKAGSLIHRRFVKSRGSASKVTLQQIGKNMFGRIGISAALAGFYTLFDYWSSGLSPTLYPGRQRKYSTIGEAFTIESPRFISGVTSCK